LTLRPGEGSLVFNHPHLQIATALRPGTLAMEVLASQNVRDRSDVQLLLDLLQITTHVRTWSVVDRHFPDAENPARPGPPSY